MAPEPMTPHPLPFRLSTCILKCSKKLATVKLCGKSSISNIKTIKIAEEKYLIISCKVGCGDFQFLFRIFLAFDPYSPMTIRFILVCLRMFLSVWKTLHAYPILREQPNFSLYTNDMNFYFGIFSYILNRNLMNDH